MRYVTKIISLGFSLASIYLLYKLIYLKESLNHMNIFVLLMVHCWFIFLAFLKKSKFERLELQRVVFKRIYKS